MIGMQRKTIRKKGKKLQKNIEKIMKIITKNQSVNYIVYY